MKKPHVLSRLITAITLALSLAFLLVVFFSPTAVEPLFALNITVTRFDDPPPGICLPDDCSLREAIIDTNADSGADTITLPKLGHSGVHQPGHQSQVCGSDGFY